MIPHQKNQLLFVVLEATLEWLGLEKSTFQPELLNINISLSIQYQLSCLSSYQYQYQYQLFSRGLININTLSITQKTPLSISISIHPINISL